MTLDKAAPQPDKRQALATFCSALAYLCYAMSTLPLVYSLWRLQSCPNFYDCDANFIVIAGILWIGAMLVGFISSIIAWKLGSRDWFPFLLPLSSIIAIIALSSGADHIENDLGVQLLSILPTLFVGAILGRRLVSAMMQG